MSKRNRQREIPMVVGTVEDVEVVQTETDSPGQSVLITGTDVRESIEIVPEPRMYSAPPCPACSALRPKDTNYTRVYGHSRDGRSIIRYLRCGFCGNTFKDAASR